MASKLKNAYKMNFSGAMKGLDEFEDITINNLDKLKNVNINSKNVIINKPNSPIYNRKLQDINEDDKTKRSYMLKKKQIEMVYDLKSKNPDIDFSDIVGFAIEDFYEKNMNEKYIIQQ